METVHIRNVCFVMLLALSSAFLAGDTGNQLGLSNMVESLQEQVVLLQGQIRELTAELGALHEDSDCSCMALTKVNRCPDGWTLRNNSCYFYYVFPQTWDDARKTCERIGGHLVTLETVEEDVYVKRFIDEAKTKSGQTRDTYTWLGASDHLQEGVWLWVTGQKVALHDWRGGHASNDGNPGVEDCMDYSFGAWNDNSCSSIHASLCEKMAAFMSE